MAVLEKTGLELPNCKGHLCYWSSSHFQNLLLEKAHKDLVSLLEIIYFIMQKNSDLCSNFRCCMSARLNAISDQIVIPEEMVFFNSIIKGVKFIEFVNNKESMIILQGRSAYGINEKKIIGSDMKEMVIRESDLKNMFN